MLLFIMQGISISLIAVSLLLIVVQIRTRLDEALMYSGISVILLSLFCSVDLWGHVSPGWYSLQHIFFCFFPLAILKCLTLICKNKTNIFAKILIVAAFINCVLFAAGIMFRKSEGMAIPTMYYFCVFIPFLLVSIGANAQMLFKHARSSQLTIRRVVRWHLLLVVVLLCCAAVDLLQLWSGRCFFESAPSFTIFGVLGLGIVLTYLFSECLILLIQQ